MQVCAQSAPSLEDRAAPVVCHTKGSTDGSTLLNEPQNNCKAAVLAATAETDHASYSNPAHDMHRKPFPSCRMAPRPGEADSDRLDQILELVRESRERCQPSLNVDNLCDGYLVLNNLIGVAVEKYVWSKFSLSRLKCFQWFGEIQVNTRWVCSRCCSASCYRGP